ncbi:hypothetical protein GIB67_012403 [Kingdonia uniflora]|uniref:Membrane insertase YidC/Oxa/ALB C-terminal domain-containing protein n=1 Tax=Kingdonia uniflora TaxID=39325 RepID=A0A7J7LM85_9MAGN|nr:hypothetical protein GIB67_012403 [Kingdonia uniflora]
MYKYNNDLKPANQPQISNKRTTIMLRCIRRLSIISSSSFSSIVSRSIHTQISTSLFFFSSPSNISNFTHTSQPPSLTNWGSPNFSNNVSFRSFSAHSSLISSNTQNEVLNLEFDRVAEGGVVVGGGDHWYDPFVETTVSVFDGYHHLSGFPWWVIIASSTLALRVALLPVLILQMKKMKRFAELFPKLPPPFPPPLSGKTYREQFLEFRKEKRAVQCPSVLWGLAFISLQIPCFLLWMTTFRTMSLGHHPGFEYGGTLWFQNLTEFPHGVLGPVFPMLIAGLHYVNIQISFKTSNINQVPGLLSLLAKYYKFYLNILTLPIFAVGFYIPQGSLVYWVTNSSLTVIQQLTLNHTALREILGLPAKNASMKEKFTEDLSTVQIREFGSEKEYEILVQNLSPDELFSLSVQMLGEEKQDKAISFLRLALERDPKHVRALVVLGQTLMQKGMLVPAIEYFERSISKLCLVGYPIKDEEIGLLILASSWAGVTYIQQGRIPEGLEHLKRITYFDEPQDLTIKSQYYESLKLLASALTDEGRKTEAAEYLQRAAIYDTANTVHCRST